MGQAVPTQHPAVVLRSHFNQLRALLAVALIALIGLTVAVVILASDENQLSESNSATPIGRINYGGFNPATGRPESAPLPQPEPRMYGFTPEQAAREALPGTRYDGGPEEGINGAAVVPSSPTTRYDGGPEEGSRGYGGFNPATGRPESAPPPQKEHPLRSRIGNPATTPAPTSAGAASVCGKAVEHPLCRRP